MTSGPSPQIQLAPLSEIVLEPEIALNRQI